MNSPPVSYTHLDVYKRQQPHRMSVLRSGYGCHHSCCPAAYHHNLAHGSFIPFLLRLFLPAAPFFVSALPLRPLTPEEMCIRDRFQIRPL